MRILILSLLLVVTLSGHAATCTSRTVGNWLAASTWNCGSGNRNGPPVSGDSVVISNGDKVTLNGDTKSLSSLTINSGGSLIGDSSSRTINLAGALTVNGSLSVAGGTASRVVLGAASSWSGSGFIALDYLDGNWQTLSLTSGSTLSLYLASATPLVNFGAFNSGSSPNNTATVYFNGSAQSFNLNGVQFPNLVVQNGAKTIGASTFVVLGNLTIDSGATLTTDSVSTVTLGGNLVINGNLSSFSGGSSVWTFNGSSAQSISGAAIFRSLTLSNSKGLTLGGNLTIGDSSWGALTLSNGKLTTGSNSVIIPRNCSGSMVTRTAGSWINGNQQLLMPAYDTNCIFDVGDSSNYAPISFAYPWHSAPLGGMVTGSTTNGDHPDSLAGLSGINSNKSVNRYWTLTPGSGATFYTYDASFQFCTNAGSADCSSNDIDSAAIPANFVVAEKVSGSWATLPVSTLSMNSRKASGATAFGVFAIGEAGSSNACGQPANTPSGLTLICQCDSFGRSALNPSPMFTSSNWIVSTSDTTGKVPYIDTTTGFLRLTENTGNNAKAATVPGFFPAAGNYISVEFKHYAYGSSTGSGADGIAMTLSDLTVSPVPGAFGGSLGYAQKTGINGFAGGWIGVAVDEYGNFRTNTEGRVGGVSFLPDTVSVRGSGSGTTGYPYLAGSSASLNPEVDNASSSSPARGHYYQIIVDARNSASGQALVAVNRDTTGTRNSYTNVIPSFDAYAAATSAGHTQAAVPANWQMSLTGSTGGANNIHELGEVRICAQYYTPPDGGAPGGFSAIDEAYTSAVQNFLTGHIYTKLAGTAFKLKVAALSNSQILTTYAATASKNVTIKLVDNTDGACGSDADRVLACATTACNGKAAISGGSQTLAYTSADKGIKTTADFNLASAYANLVAVMTDGTTTACSIDSFSVRPTLFSSVTSSATNAALTGFPRFKAGTDSFTLSATANVSGYNGTPKINASAMSATAAGWTLGSLVPTTFPTAIPGASTSTSTGSFTYSEVGNFRFLGYNPATDSASARGVYDDSWVAVDSAATKNDCIAGSYANTKDSNGKYGCLFGLYDRGSSAPNSALFGRFVPDHFTYVGGGITSFCAGFTYMGQPGLGVAYRLEARNGNNAVTSNYSAVLATPYPVTVPSLVAEDQATANQGCDLSSRIGALPSGQWVAGVFILNDANANNVPDTAASIFSRPSTPVDLSAGTCTANRANAGGPFRLLDLGVGLIDSDGVTLDVMDMNPATAGSCSSAACTARKIGTTSLLYGRLNLSNAYGSELLPLTVPVQVQYWTSGGWLKNSADSCTLLTQPTRQDTGNGGLIFYAPPDTSRNALAPGEAISQMGSSTAASVPVASGDARMVLRAPGSSAQGPGFGNFGYVDVIGSKLGTGSWLPPSGNARACFGACGPRSPVIYLRESY